MSAVSQKAVEAMRTSLEGIAMLSEPEARQALEAALPHLTPTEASAPVQPEPDADTVEQAANRLLNNLWAGLHGRTEDHEANWRLFEHQNPGVKALHETLRRTQPSTARPSQGEAVAWMRRWAADKIDVMKLPKAERPSGWSLYAVSEAKMLPDDLPLGFLAPVDVGAAVAAKGVINPPTYWKRQYKHGAPTYVLKQLHFPSKQVGLEWVRIHRPDEVAQAEAAWADEVPSFDWNIWADPAAIRQSTLGEPKEGGENG